MLSTAREIKALILLLSGIVLICEGCVCGNNEKQEQEAGADLITVGVSQVGAESDWRTANSISFKNTFCEENGYALVFEDGKQKQENQIRAVRSFIQQDVDYIVLAPVCERGWDTVLKEAKSMGIPVIIADRMAEVDEELFTAWVGSDFRLQGEKACAWLEAYLEKTDRDTDEVNIVDIQGTPGASAQTGRSEALVEAAEQNGWTIMAAQSGEYTKAKGWEVMTGILEEGTPVDVVYCENDNMAFGVIEAIEEAGRTAGKEDIVVISFDATREGLALVKQGKILLNVECNPMLGPQVGKIIQQLKSGEEPEKYTTVTERLYASNGLVEEVVVDVNRYRVETVTEETVKGRNY